MKNQLLLTCILAGILTAPGFAHAKQLSIADSKDLFQALTDLGARAAGNDITFVDVTSVECKSSRLQGPPPLVIGNAPVFEAWACTARDHSDDTMLNNSTVISWSIAEILEKNGATTVGQQYARKVTAARIYCQGGTSIAGLPNKPVCQITK